MLNLSVEFITTSVRPRQLAKIMLRINKEVAPAHIQKAVTPSRFKQSIFHELPGVAQKRSKRYERRKLRQYGHNLPNVLTGRLKEHFTSGAGVKPTGTQYGGKVTYRVYWAGQAKKKSGGRGFTRQGWRDANRAEFSTLSEREKLRLATAMEKDFQKQVNDAINLKKTKRK